MSAGSDPGKGFVPGGRRVFAVSCGRKREWKSFRLHLIKAQILWSRLLLMTLGSQCHYIGFRMSAYISREGKESIPYRLTEKGQFDSDIMLSSAAFYRIQKCSVKTQIVPLSWSLIDCPFLLVGRCASFTLLSISAPWPSWAYMGLKEVRKESNGHAKM